MASVGNVEFLADDRIDSVHMTQFLKVQRTKHVSVVRKCKGLHVHCFCFCYKGVDF